MPSHLNAKPNAGTSISTPGQSYLSSALPGLSGPQSELDEKSEGVFLQAVPSESFSSSSKHPLDHSKSERNFKSRTFSAHQGEAKQLSFNKGKVDQFYEEDPPCGSETISIHNTENAIGGFIPFSEKISRKKSPLSSQKENLHNESDRENLAQKGNIRQSAAPHPFHPPKVPSRGSNRRKLMTLADRPNPLQAPTETPPAPPLRRSAPAPLYSPKEEKLSASSESRSLTALEMENWQYMKRENASSSPWNLSPSAPSSSSPVLQRNALNRDVRVSEEDFGQLMEFVRNHHPQQALTFLRERYPEQTAFVSEHGSDIANGIAITVSIGVLITAGPAVGPGLLACGVGGIIAGGTGIAAGKLREHPSCPENMRRPLAGLQIAASATSLLLLSFTGAIGGGAPALVGSVLDATNTGLTVATSVPGLLADDSEPSNA